jgi:hypothetical protein
VHVRTELVQLRAAVRERDERLAVVRAEAAAQRTAAQDSDAECVRLRGRTQALLRRASELDDMLRREREQSRGDASRAQQTAEQALSQAQMRIAVLSRDVMVAEARQREAVKEVLVCCGLSMRDVLVCGAGGHTAFGTGCLVDGAAAEAAVMETDEKQSDFFWFWFGCFVLVV